MILRAVIQLFTKKLFKKGTFISHSGKTLHWKIDCDALTDDDIKTLADVIRRNIPLFSDVVGIPKGGTKLANVLRPYISDNGPILIIDDVFTTGTSMRETKQLVSVYKPNKPICGVVIFARAPTPSWITPIFRLHMTL
jgi:orotate phosphoribosyltransferase